jgi:hypothetical protein
MKIKRVKPAVLQVTLQSHELAALASAVRWIINGAPGEYPQDSVKQLKKILDNYETESRSLTGKHSAKYTRKIAVRDTKEVD